MGCDGELPAMKIEQVETNGSSRLTDNEPNSTATSTKLAAEQQNAPKRNSKRGTTKIKKESETVAGDKDEELLGNDGESNIKRRRTWELWSASDKRIFFDVLNEFGKDFDAIHQHFKAVL